MCREVEIIEFERVERSKLTDPNLAGPLPPGFSRCFGFSVSVGPGKQRMSALLKACF